MADKRSTRDRVDDAMDYVTRTNEAPPDLPLTAELDRLLRACDGSDAWCSDLHGYLSYAYAEQQRGRRRR